MKIVQTPTEQQNQPTENREKIVSLISAKIVSKCHLFVLWISFDDAHTIFPDSQHKKQSHVVKCVLFFICTIKNYAIEFMQ